MTGLEAAAAARAVLVAAGIQPSTATLDADLLARDAAGWDLATWLSRRNEPVDAVFASRYDRLIHRRAQREPVAYIRGVQEFWGREFIVSPSVLIPRPETELLVETALERLDRHAHAHVVDVGTGSGCIAITVAAERPAAAVTAVEISAAALDTARQNAERHGVASRIRFVEGAYLAGIPAPVDVILANPPYVAERDRAGLSPEVREHEPAVALFGGRDGWRDIRTLLQQSGDVLAPHGHLLMEMGYGQYERLADEVAAVRTLALEGIRDDLQGIPRVALIRRR